MSDFEVYQDSPAYGCSDNPSYKWYSYVTSNGHIRDSFGPFDTEQQAFDAVKNNLS